MLDAVAVIEPGLEVAHLQDEALVGEGPLQDGPEAFGLDGAGLDVVGPPPHGLGGGGQLRVGGDEDHGHLGIAGPGDLQEAHPVDPLGPDVGDQDMDGFTVQHVVGGLPVLDQGGLTAQLPLQEQGDLPATGLLLVDDDPPGSLRRSHDPSSAPSLRPGGTRRDF